MTEDEVKEICARMFHEKIKHLEKDFKKHIDLEIHKEISLKKTKPEEFLCEADLERMRINCHQHMSLILRKAYEKFMGSFRL